MSRQLAVQCSTRYAEEECL